MKVCTVKCPKCGDIIYSRAQHDFHYCSCGYIFVDGGFEYTRVGAENLDDINFKDLEIDTTKEELYNDWNKGINKYGIIKNNYEKDI